MDLLFTRNQEDTIFRAVSLCLISAVAEGRLIKRELSVENIKELLIKFNIEKDVTLNEEKYLMDEETTKEENEKFIWKYECVYLLLWALWYIENLEEPKDICDTGKVTAIILGNWVDNFVKNANLRSIEEIVWTYEKYLGYLNDDSLNLDVTKERLYTLSRLVAKDNLSWDKIETII